MKVFIELKIQKDFLFFLFHNKHMPVFSCCCVLCVSWNWRNIFFPAQNKQYCRFGIGAFFTSAEFNVYLAAVARHSKTASLSLFCNLEELLHTMKKGREKKKKSGPSVDADGNLWTVYKLQSLSEQRCPKYVIQIDQSGW